MNIELCKDCLYCEKQQKNYHCKECFGQLCIEIDDCPNGYELNEYNELLNKKYKVKADRKKVTTTTKKAKKIDENKQYIIKQVNELLLKIAENVEIVNDAKIITFNFNNEKFKIDLIKTKK